MNYCTTCGTKGCTQHAPQPIGSINRSNFIQTRYGKRDRQVHFKGSTIEIENIGNTTWTIGKWTIPPCTIKSIFSGNMQNPFCKVIDACPSKTNDACEYEKDANDCFVLDENGNKILLPPRTELIITGIYLDHPAIKTMLSLK